MPSGKDGHPYVFVQIVPRLTVLRCLRRIPARITRVSNAEPSSSSLTKKKKDREIDTVGSKSLGPQCHAIVVELLFLGSLARSGADVVNGLVFL